MDPGKFADFVGRRPTLSGQLFRWEIQAGVHALNLFPGVAADAATDAVPLTHQEHGVGPDSFGICARSGPRCAIPFNGTAGDLDKRHRFDLYLSKTRYRIIETTPDGLYNLMREREFPAGVSLPFQSCQLMIVQQVYHTSNDRGELVQYDPYNAYWYNNRPWGDERHGDNVSLEVLSQFPAIL